MAIERDYQINEVIVNPDGSINVISDYRVLGVSPGGGEQLKFTVSQNGTFDPVITDSVGTSRFEYGDGNSDDTNTPSHTYADTPPYNGNTLNGNIPTLTGFNSDADGISSITLSVLTALTDLTVTNNTITTIDITANTALLNVDISDNQLDTSSIDGVINQLDTNGLINGTLDYSGNAGSPTSSSVISYFNLIAKGWTITGDVPLKFLSVSFTVSVNNTFNATVTDITNTYDWDFGDTNTDVGNSVLNIYSGTPPYNGDGRSLDPTDATALTLNSNQMSAVDFTAMTGVTDLRVSTNNLTTIDVSSITSATEIRVDNNQLTSLDISSNTLLDRIEADNNLITSLSITNNTLLTTVLINDNQLDSASIDGVINQLDTNGLSGGTLDYSNNPNNPTSISLISYLNLLDKGWTITGVAPVSDDFIIKIKSDNTGTSNDNQFTLPLRSAQTYNFNWSTSDGQSGSQATDADLTFTFPANGEYYISINGTFPRIYFNNTGDKAKLIDIVSWGNIVWSSMLFAFDGCINLTSVTATDAPDLTNVSDMRSMFDTCNSMSALDTSAWDVSGVTDMRSIFLNCNSLTTLDVSGWDTSNLSLTTSMFSNCLALTALDVSGWSTGNITSMGSMFSNCSSLITLDLSGWNTSSVTSMASTFRDCSSLTTLNATGLNTSNVISMNKMFFECSALTTISGLSSWDTSSITDMGDMFRSCTVIDVDVSTFDITSLTTASFMFFGSAFSQTNYDLMLPAWDAYGTSSVTFHAGTAKYGAGAPATARANMVGRSWIITDGGPA
jgi:surface protein